MYLLFTFGRINVSLLDKSIFFTDTMFQTVVCIYYNVNIDQLFYWTFIGYVCLHHHTHTLIYYIHSLIIFLS